MLHFSWDRRVKYANDPDEWSATTIPVTFVPPWKDIFGYAYQPFTRDFVGLLDIRLPLAIFFVLFSSAVAGFFWRRAKRFPPSHCKYCGYNLCGLTGGRCPECGAKAPVVPLTQDDSPPRPSNVWRALARTSIALVSVVSLLWGVSIGWAWYLNIRYPPPLVPAATGLTPAIGLPPGWGFGPARPRRPPNEWLGISPDLQGFMTFP